MSLKVLIMLNVLACIHGMPNKTCNRIKIHDRWYDREILWANSGRPFNLYAHKNTNTVFFSYTVPETYSDVDFQLAFIDMDTKEFQNIAGIRGGCSVAIDHANDDIYLGGSDGIYKYNMMTKLADFYKEAGKNIWALFFRRNLFYISYPDQKLHIEVDGKFAVVKEFEGFEVDHFHVTADNENIYFANKTGFYKYDNSRLNINVVNDRVTVRQIAEDNDGDLYVCTNFGVFIDLKQEGFKKVSDDIGYVIYSALGSFYIPSCIMVFVYIRIYYAAKARARRGIRKNPRPRPNEQQTSFSNPAKGTRPMPTSSSLHMPSGADPINSNNNRESQISTIETQQVAIPTVTCDFASDISTSEAGEVGPPPPDERKDTLKVVTCAQVTRNPLATCPYRSSTLSVNGELQLQQSQRCRASSVAIDTDMVSEMEPSSSDSGVATRCAVVKPLKLRICQPIFGKKSDSTRRQEKTHPTKAELEPALPKQHKPRDPEREKRRLARKKEKRATLILGLIMGSFIACWLPFFFLYILKAACRWCVIPSSAFAIAFWLGYMNSVLNPVIYTIFNKDFRRAFRRILFK